MDKNEEHMNIDIPIQSAPAYNYPHTLPNQIPMMYDNFNGKYLLSTPLFPVRVPPSSLITSQPPGFQH